MRIATLLAVLAPVTLGATLTHAADLTMARTTSAAAFASMDRNGDQRISKTEAGMYKHIIDRFAHIDTNGDGFITQDELVANLTAGAGD